jgi:hypothetical protein
MTVRKPGGRSSKGKGSRVERVVRDYFRALGYISDKMPLSGAMKGYEGDVKITRPGHKPELIEVKSRATQFESIYQLMGTNLEVAFAHGNRLIHMSYHFENLLKTEVYFSTLGHVSTNRVMDKILKMEEYLKGSDYLVIKGDYKPLLFIRYL